MELFKGIGVDDFLLLTKEMQSFHSNEFVHRDQSKTKLRRPKSAVHFSIIFFLPGSQLIIKKMSLCIQRTANALFTSWLHPETTTTLLDYGRTPLRCHLVVVCVLQVLSVSGLDACNLFNQYCRAH